MGRIRDIAESTDQELAEYLDHHGWTSNPFAHAATLDEYVLPGDEEIADIASHLSSYTGPILIHSPYSGVGKTTLLKMLLEEYGQEYQTPTKRMTPAGNGDLSRTTPISRRPANGARRSRRLLA